MSKVLYKFYDMETMTQEKLNGLALERNTLAKENQELKSKLELYENGVYFSSEVDEKDKQIDKLKKQLHDASIQIQELTERDAKCLTI